MKQKVSLAQMPNRGDPLQHFLAPMFQIGAVHQRSSWERSSPVNGRKSAHKNATKPNAIDATAPTTSNVHIVYKSSVSTCLALLLLGGGPWRALSLYVRSWSKPTSARTGRILVLTLAVKTPRYAILAM